MTEFIQIHCLQNKRKSKILARKQKDLRPNLKLWYLGLSKLVWPIKEKKSVERILEPPPPKKKKKKGKWKIKYKTKNKKSEKKMNRVREIKRKQRINFLLW